MIIIVINNCFIDELPLDHIILLDVVISLEEYLNLIQIPTTEKKYKYFEIYALLKA